jgi:hypothetical protein
VGAVPGAVPGAGAVAGAERTISSSWGVGSRVCVRRVRDSTPQPKPLLIRICGLCESTALVLHTTGYSYDTLCLEDVDVIDVMDDMCMRRSTRVPFASLRCTDIGALYCSLRSHLTPTVSVTVCVSVWVWVWVWVWVSVNVSAPVSVLSVYMSVSESEEWKRSIHMRVGVFRCSTSFPPCLFLYPYSNAISSHRGIAPPGLWRAVGLV